MRTTAKGGGRIRSRKAVKMLARRRSRRGSVADDARHTTLGGAHDGLQRRLL